jgi:hypothetical protein
MGIGDGVANVDESQEQLAKRQDGRRLVKLPNRLAERPALDEAHDIIRLAGRVGLQSVDRYDAGMLQLAGNRRLVHKPPPRLWTAALRSNLFEGHRPAQLLVPRQADLPEPSLRMQNFDGETRPKPTLWACTRLVPLGMACGRR